MTTGEITQPYPEDERQRLQALGFEPVGADGLMAGGGLLVEAHDTGQRLYVPLEQISSERVEAIRFYTDPYRQKGFLCTEVIQKFPPHLVETRGVEMQHIELRPDCQSSGPIRGGEDLQNISPELLSLLGAPITEQLESSGFINENPSVDAPTSVWRLNTPDKQIVAIVEQDTLKGLFSPIDQTDYPKRVEEWGELRVIGIDDNAARDPFDAAMSQRRARAGVRVSNGWAEFTIDPEYPIFPKQPRIVREPTLDELKLTPLPEKVEPGGFVQNGVNDSETIKRLESINDISIADLTISMRPGVMSRAGFIGRNETLVNVMVCDNDVVRAHDLTHNHLAAPLSYIDRLYELGLLSDTGPTDFPPQGTNEITIGGHPYAVGVTQWRGYQESPFGDGTDASCDYTILNLESGHVLHVSSLIHEMVRRYGFYEGRGSGYRVAPEEIIATFSHLRRAFEESNADPICALTAGKTDSITLRTTHQIARFNNLYRAGVPRIVEANATISFTSTAELLSFLSDDSNESLVHLVDMQVLDTLQPATLTLSKYRGVRQFTKLLGRLDVETQHKIITAISDIDTSQQPSYIRTGNFEEVIEASVKEVDGNFVRQPAAKLLEKLDYDSADFLHKLYRSAGGRHYRIMEQKPGEPRATVREIVDELDEPRAKALASVFEEQLAPVVATFSKAMRIDSTQPFAEQAVAFFKKYHLLEKAQEIADHFLVQQNRPSITLPDWVRISEIVEGLHADMSPEDVNEEDKAFLDEHDFSIQDLLDARAIYPSGEPPTVVLQLYNGTLARRRKQK